MRLTTPSTTLVAIVRIMTVVSITLMIQINDITFMIQINHINFMIQINQSTQINLIQFNVLGFIGLMVVQLLVTHDMIPNLKEKFGDGMGHMRLAEASE